MVSLISTASWPLLLIGLIIIWQGNAATGNFSFDLGIIFFSAVVLFHTVTLPVEFNASSRAIKQLVSLGIIDEVGDERREKGAVGGSYDLCGRVGYVGGEFDQDIND